MDEKQKRETDPELRNEGEGSRTAARRYDEKATQAAKDAKHVEAAAKAAEKALEGKEGNALREADARGRKAQHR